MLYLPPTTLDCIFVDGPIISPEYAQFKQRIRNINHKRFLPNKLNTVVHYRVRVADLTQSGVRFPPDILTHIVKYVKSDCIQFTHRWWCACRGAHAPWWSSRASLHFCGHQDTQPGRCPLCHGIFPQAPTSSAGYELNRGYTCAVQISSHLNTSHNYQSVTIFFWNANLFQQYDLHRWSFLIHPVEACQKQFVFGKNKIYYLRWNLLTGRKSETD